MKKLPKITLEQWAAFKAVVDEGSFARAAEALNKSQSTVSYTVAKMNEWLPAPALEIKGRKAELTETGKVLYRQAAQLLDKAASIEKAAVYHAQGWEPEITLAVDAVAPLCRVFTALSHFSEHCAFTRIRILETSLSGTDEALFQKQCHIAIMARVPPGFIGKRIGAIEMVPVASPEHPLASSESPVSEEEMRQHRQVVLRDSGIKREQNAGWLGSEQRWTTSHFSTSVDAVKAGLGFAFLPEHRVHDDIQAGTLRRIMLTMEGVRRIELYLVVAEADLAGPATLTLSQHIQRAFLANL